MPEIHKLANGFCLITEYIEHVESASITISIPGGINLDPKNACGASLLLAELTSRGAAGKTSREIISEFDARGIRHSEAAGSERFSYSASLLPEHLPVALNLLADMILQPDLPEAEVNNIRAILLQDLNSLKDNPARRALIKLNSVTYPDPFNRPSLGVKDDIEKLEIGLLKSEWQQKFKPDGAVISVAGNIDPDKVLKLVEEKFAKWQGTATKQPEFTDLNIGVREHIQESAAQLQIALAYRSAKFNDPDYYVAKVATGILAGGMFGRLFTEVREKRGLCYSVYAKHSANTNAGVVICYSGTTPERAHETLSVMQMVLASCHEGITAEELERVKADILAGVIIGEESVISRAANNLSDWWLVKRIRSLEEIQTAIESVTIADIAKYCERYPSSEYSLVTLGAKQIF